MDGLVDLLIRLKFEEITSHSWNSFKIINRTKIKYKIVIQPKNKSNLLTQIYMKCK